MPPPGRRRQAVTSTGRSAKNCSRVRQRLRTWLAGIFLIAAGAGWILTGVYPADVDENLHVLGALFIMILGNIGLVLAPAMPEHPPIVRWLAPILGAVGLIGAGLFFTGNDLGLGLGGMERVAAYPILAWMLSAGLILLLSRRAGLAAAHSINQRV